jgi:tetratricopeptide (TPR) repeat protein
MIASSFALVLLAAGGDGREHLLRAEQAYRAGDFEGAVLAYRRALDDPAVPRGLVLYDLGNCEYRLGRPGRALHAWRCAQLRLPDDHRVEANLELVERQLGVGTDARDPLARAFAALTGEGSARALLAICAVLQSLGIAGLVLLRRRRALAALCVLVGLTAGVHVAWRSWRPPPPEGVVLEGRIALRSEPHAEMPVTAELRMGERVVVVEASDRWARVVHERGAGWTERAGLGVIE